MYKLLLPQPISKGKSSLFLLMVHPYKSSNLRWDKFYLHREGTSFPVLVGYGSRQTGKRESKSVNSNVGTCRLNFLLILSSFCTCLCLCLSVCMHMRLNAFQGHFQRWQRKEIDLAPHLHLTFSRTSRHLQPRSFEVLPKQTAFHTNHLIIQQRTRRVPIITDRIFVAIHKPTSKEFKSGK